MIIEIALRTAAPSVPGQRYRITLNGRLLVSEDDDPLAHHGPITEEHNDSVVHVLQVECPTHLLRRDVNEV